jgi:hypothetical protein
MMFLAKRRAEGRHGAFFAAACEPRSGMSGVNYFFSLTTIISPYQRQLLFDC